MPTNHNGLYLRAWRGMTNEHRRMPSKIALEPTPTPPRRRLGQTDCDLIAKDSNIVSRRYGTGIANSINLPRPTFVDDLRSPETITPR